MSLILEKHFIVLEYFLASLNSFEIVHYLVLLITLNIQESRLNNQCNCTAGKQDSPFATIQAIAFQQNTVGLHILCYLRAAYTMYLCNDVYIIIIKI